MWLCLPEADKGADGQPENAAARKAPKPPRKPRRPRDPPSSPATGARVGSDGEPAAKKGRPAPKTAPQPKTMEKHHWDEAAEGDGTGTPGTSWLDRQWKVKGLTPPDPDYADKTRWSINEANALPHPEKDELCRRVLKQIRDKRDEQARFRKGRNAVSYPDVWDERYEELKAFKAQHGNMKVPKGKKDQEASKYTVLANWVDTQRAQRKKRERGEQKHQMTQERMDKLNAIGFVWDSQRQAWEANFEKLKRYKQDNGDCKVPKGEARALSAWVDVQKAQKKKFDKGDPKAKITKERIDKLDEMGFVWG